MAINKELNIRYINGKKYRFAPTIGEQAALIRKPFVSLLAGVLEGLPAETIDKAVAVEKAQHDKEEDARIASVEAHHATIRRNGVCMETMGTRWYTTNRG